MDSVMSPTDIFKTEVFFNILYDTIDGKEKNPHFDKPNFSIGGLQFNFNARGRNSDGCYEAFMELNEASKKDLAPGYEISVKRFDMKFSIEDGKTRYWAMISPVSLSGGAARIFPFFANPIRHIDAQISMEFDNVYPAHPPQFLNAEAAKGKHADCKIILKDDENKEVFVNRAILAMQSPFFETLFFGEFKEKDEYDVKLSNVIQADFLHYLYSVYPPPNRPFAFNRLEALLGLADRFLNTTLVSAIEKFLMEMTDKTVGEKRQMLIWADKYNMTTLFGETLKIMNKTDVKELDPVTRLNFKKENHDLFVARVLEML